MGADFIGYLVVGPGELDPGARKGAVDQARGMLAYVKAVHGLKTLKARDRAREKYAPFTRHLDHSNTRLDEDIAFLVGLRAAEIVDDVYGVWAGAGRDNMTRVLSHMHGHRLKKPMRIVAAGDMSWGDEPQGYAYQTLKAAEWLGLFPILGLE